MDSPSAATDAIGLVSGLPDRVARGLAKGTAYVIFFLDDSFDVRWVSPSVTDMLGWTVEGMIGRSGLEFVHPDDLPDLARLVAEEQRNPHHYGLDPARRTFDEARFATVDGGWKPFEFAANNLIADPEVAGFVVVMRDVTERRLTDDVYTSLIEGAPLVQTVTRVAELLSWQCGGLPVALEASTGAAATAGQCGDDLPVVEVEHVGGGGRVVVWHPADPPPSEWTAVLAERAERMLVVAVQHALGRDELRRRVDEKSAIIAAVSHDLRSPIAAIQLMSTLLDGNGESLTQSQRRQLVSRINADAHRTSRLLADLTSVDRLLHGSADLRLRPVSLRPLVERVLADDPDRERVVRLLPGPDVAVVADPVLTERIVDNLVANAAKYTPVGARVELSIAVSDGEVALHVDDDGPGVPVDDRTAIFDAYARGTGSVDRPGSGMGLFLVRTFAEVQGGTVFCDESPLGGARFSVVLPRHQARD